MVVVVALFDDGDGSEGLVVGSSPSDRSIGSPPPRGSSVSRGSEPSSRVPSVWKDGKSLFLLPVVCVRR